MAATSFKRSLFDSNPAKYDSFLVGNAAYTLSDFELIETQTVSGTSTTLVTFSTIPQTYKHLQIRGIAQRYYGASQAPSYIFVRFNGDTANNYPYHGLKGDGATASSYPFAIANGAAPLLADELPSSFTSNIFGASITDILDYTVTTKNKTVRKLAGNDRNGAGMVGLTSGVWLNTAAVTAINLWMAGDTFSANSTFSLYGIK